MLDEVKKTITLPEFDGSAVRTNSADDVELDDVVVQQLRDLVYTIAALYRDNPFHNFEHASHVTMSVTKLLARIVAPSDVTIEGQRTSVKQIASTLHDHTYGITSDPLTQFAVVFSALVHDVDHTGVPNSQLVREGTIVAKLYRNKSVAEQNSVDLAWDLLMDARYSELRAAIYSSHAELRRFRQLLKPKHRRAAQLLLHVLRGDAAGEVRQVTPARH